ncbi:hypothetical protein ACIXUB_00490 [Bacteroides fragilis]
MKSHKEYKNEYQRWTEEIQALNEAVQCDTKKLDASLPCLQVYHFVAHFLRLALSVR